MRKHIPICYPFATEDKFDLEDESTNATPSAFPTGNSRRPVVAMVSDSDEPPQECRGRWPWWWW